MSHVRSLLEYGSCVWNAKYLRDARRLVLLQKRCTTEIRDVSGMEYVDRLCCTGLYSIHGRLLRIDLVMLWKSFHSYDDLSLQLLYDVVRDVGLRGYRFELVIPVCQSGVRRRSFIVRDVSVCNLLPFRVVEEGSVGCFKRRMDVVHGSKLPDTI